MKVSRDALRNKYGGRCAYCGCELGERWHEDHVEPVHRLPGGGMCYPERDTQENLVPSCPPCNIDKATFPLEEWRRKLERSLDVLIRNSSTYRHARRFGLIQETEKKIVFYFEKGRT